jgi:hypothetical protein
MVLAMVFLAIGHPLLTFDKIGVRHSAVEVARAESPDSYIVEKAGSAGQTA